MNASRVAVIVTPGVGDDARGATVDSLVDGLVRHGHFATAISDDVTVPPPPPEPPAGADEDWVPPPTSSQTIARRRLQRAPGSSMAAIEVDAYELHWADLSRFPVGLRRIVFTLFALVLELGRLGYEALGPAARDGTSREARVAGRSLRALGNWMAFGVVPITALIGILGVALTAALFAPTAWLDVVLVGLVALIGIGLLLAIGRGLERAGWSPPVGGVAWPLLVALAVGVVTWILMLLTGVGAANAESLLANLVVATAAWPLRAAWLVLIVLWVSSALWTVALIRGGHGPGARLRRAGFVSLLSASIPAILLGFLSAITLAAASTLSLQALGDRGWEGADTSLVCINSASDWTLGDCVGAGGSISVHDWLIQLFGRLLEPLGVAAVLLAAIGLFAVAVLALFTLGAVLRTWGRRRLPDWVTHYVPQLIVARVLPDTEGIPQRIGGALSRLLSRLTSTASIAGLVLISLAIAATTLVSWVITPVGDLPLIHDLIAPFGADFTGVLATALALALLVIRFLPNELTSEARGMLGPLRRGLDIVGDVTNYIRPHGTSPRFAIVARYRALLERVVTMPHADGEVGYTGLVLISHSQGTVYTAATLFGDRARTPPVVALDEMGEQDPGPALAAMNGVAMLTFGSPIQQTYDRFFAGQYEDWIRRRRNDLSPITIAWFNAYRPGDYVGRAVHGDPIVSPDLVQPSAGPVLAEDGPPEIAEYCLSSAAAHTGYWNEHDLAALADHLIERAAGGAPGAPVLDAGAQAEPPADR